MPTDTTEIRKEMLPQVNAVTRDGEGEERSKDDVRADLEARHGQVWSTKELQQDFDVIGFSAPVVVVCRKSDNQKGSLEFVHSPRLYYGFQPHNP